jgi:XTP/dITP diphosphohydrolase
MALELVVASANPHKVDEIAAILGPSVTLVPRPDSVGEVVEDGDTLEANARLKAVAIMRATGSAAVADDTGFEVDALGGAPGVYAARYAGEGATSADNVAKVLAELARVGAVRPDQRRARFRTVALVAWPDGTETDADGVIEGIVIDTPRGASGFGYDPIFVPDLAAAEAVADADASATDDAGAFASAGRTFAELSANEKHAISHRGRAFRALATLLDRR